MTDAATTTAPAEAPPSETLGKALPAKTRKKLRERARRTVEADFEAAEVERIRAEKLAERGDDAPAAPAAAAPSPAPATPERTDAQRAGDAAAFLAGVLFPVLAYLAPWFGPWTLNLADFTDDQAAEDGRAWAGVLARYPWLDRTVSWAAPLGRVIRRVRAIATKAGPTP